MSQGWQRLFGNGSDCQAEWKRSRPMAAVMSSDAKALRENENPDNFVGKRYCWIKMSDPSVEALRQAFLDPESRISLDHEPPRVTHAHVRKIQVAGTRFLQDQAMHLSPNLNCLIGGRGSGKSMLFESIRLGLRGEIPFKDVDEKDHVAARQVKRLKSTFTNKTSIELDVSHDELQDRFVVDSSGLPARIEDREVEDSPTVFRRLNTLIFSQEEITQLADRQKSLLDFVDSLALDRLEPHRAGAWEIIDRLKAGRQFDEALKRMDSELAAIKQEVQEFSRQLAAKAQVQEELKRHRAAQEARRYMDSLATKARETEERLKTLAEELEAEPPPLGSRVDSFPEKAFFIRAEEQIGSAYGTLAGAIRTAVEGFRKRFDGSIISHAEREKVDAAIQKAEEAFHKACDEKGLTPQEAERLRETEHEHRSKQASLKAKQNQRQAAEKQKPDMDELFQQLTDCWKKETQERVEILNDIVASETMPRTKTQDPIIKTTLAFAGDRRAFLNMWKELAPDRRTAAGRAWDDYARDGGPGNVGEQLFDAFQRSVNVENEAFGNPIQWFERNWDKHDRLPSLVRQYLEDVKEVRAEKSDKWFELMLTRVPDSADLTLFRSDGTKAGSFQKADLSTGQKNTAILSLLLARGSGPVLIDQPEDELDSEFLFRELVPMIRKAKNQRQLIIVTHNANIPVNGDAELLYSLKAEGGRGVCRTQGGLDRADVTQAVLDIMEGSEEAFRQRQEKYHF
jgi:ABC-type dipeptide/oligopeptide/nickel transport system ATPase component